MLDESMKREHADRVPPDELVLAPDDVLPRARVARHAIRGRQTGTLTLTAEGVTPTQNGPVPAYFNTATVNPGGLTITIYFPQSG